MIERVSLRPGNQFQAWLAEWKMLPVDGWTAEVVVARDGSHAVGLAYREAEAQLRLAI